MRCILIDNPGPHSQLVLSDCPMPGYSDAELLVKVQAVAVNYADLMQRSGKYPPPAGASIIPGLEISGTVVELGAHVTNFKAGDRVYALVAGGGYAEYCTVHHQLARIIPDDWPFDYAAAIPEALTTAHATVFELGQLSDNQSFLIHGAGSGITSTAIQMAATVHAEIYTTIGSEVKREKAIDLGAQNVFNYKTEDWFAAISENTIHVIVDFIGGDYFTKHIKLLANQGQLIQIACMLGYRVETNLIPILQKRLNLHGFVLRPQTIAEKTILWQNAHERWEPCYRSKEIKPIIDSTYPLEEVEKAHERMRSSKHFGKIVLVN